MDFEAAIFDLDGTLLDSMDVWEHIDIQFLQKRNIYQFRREDMQDFYDVWLFHADIDIKEMVLQKTEVVDVQWVNQDKLLNMFQKKQLHPLITYIDTLIS